MIINDQDQISRQTLGLFFNLRFSVTALQLERPRCCPGFRNLRPRLHCPARAPEPSTPGPGKPLGSTVTRHPHDVGKTVQRPAPCPCGVRRAGAAVVQSAWPRAPSSSSTAPVQPTPQAGLGPYREAAVRGGGRRAERRRQMPPGTAARQRVHRCREHGPLVIRSGSTTLRASSERRQQRGGRLPEFIRTQTLR